MIATAEYPWPLPAPELMTDLSGEIIYPESDGQPMTWNTEHYDWMVYLKEGIEWDLRSREDVLVVADALWYPVEDHPEIRIAPDVFVALGRPRGPRSSYMQWKEDNIAPQVVFEIISPGNSVAEMLDKLEFYQSYGVREFYTYNFTRKALRGWSGNGDGWKPIDHNKPWLSPLLGITLMTNNEGKLVALHRDGTPFLTVREVYERREQAEKQAEEASKQAELAVKGEEEAKQKASRFAAKLRELGLDPDSI